MAKYEIPSSSGSPLLGRKPASASSGIGAKQGAVLSDTLPPQPLKELLSAGGANLYVLSTDLELADTVQRASGEQYPVFVVNDWRELLVAVETGHCGIALLDAEYLGANLVPRIAALETHSDRLVILVAADRGAAQDLMGFLSDRRIHRLLIKPATLGITKLLIESAVNRCLQLRELAGGAGAGDLAVQAFSRKRSFWRRLFAIAGLLAVVGGALAAGMWLRQRSATEGRPPDSVAAAPATPTAAAPPEAAGPNASEPSPAGRFADLLRRGADAFDAGRLAAPTGDNALDYYLTVLATEPNEPTARRRLAAIEDTLFARAESALLADMPDAALAALEGVRRADPSSTRLSFLEAQVERARSAQAAKEAAKAATAASPPAATLPPPRTPVANERTELDSLLVIATARIQRGELLEPAGDSALEYVNRAADVNAGDARVARVRSALAGSLLDAARAALVASDLQQAAKLLSAARGLDADPESLALIDVELVGAQNAVAERRHTEWLALADTRLRNGALAKPAGDSALDYLQRLQGEQPNFAGLAAAWDRLATALATEARRAIAARDWPAAETALASLGQTPRADTVAPLREQLEVARLQEQYLATATPAGELRLLEAPPVVYPADAVRRNIEGWVDLEFVVDTMGVPKDITVAAAEPTGRFEEAALAAVAMYRYAPFERSGHVYERRVRVRVRFALN